MANTAVTHITQDYPQHTPESALSKPPAPLPAAKFFTAIAALAGAVPQGRSLYLSQRNLATLANGLKGASIPFRLVECDANGAVPLHLQAGAGVVLNSGKQYTVAITDNRLRHPLTFNTDPQRTSPFFPARSQTERAYLGELGLNNRRMPNRNFYTALRQIVAELPPQTEIPLHPFAAMALSQRLVASGVKDFTVSAIKDGKTVKIARKHIASAAAARDQHVVLKIHDNRFSQPVTFTTQPQQRQTPEIAPVRTQISMVIGLADLATKPR